MILLSYIINRGRMPALCNPGSFRVRGIVEVGVYEDGLDVLRYDELVCLRMRFTRFYDDLASVPIRVVRIKDGPLDVIVFLVPSPILEHLRIQARDILVRRRRYLLQAEEPLAQLHLHPRAVAQYRRYRDVRVAVADDAVGDFVLDGQMRLQVPEDLQLEERKVAAGSDGQRGDEGLQDGGYVLEDAGVGQEEVCRQGYAEPHDEEAEREQRPAPSLAKPRPRPLQPIHSPHHPTRAPQPPAPAARMRYTADGDPAIVVEFWQARCGGQKQVSVIEDVQRRQVA